MFAMRSGGDAPSVQIAKAENGYMVTLAPQGGDGGGAGILENLGIAFGAPSEAKAVQDLKKERDRLRPHVFVYSDIEDAWTAIKEFFLDGRLPKGV